MLGFCLVWGRSHNETTISEIFLSIQRRNSLFLLCSSAIAFTGKVVGISDGDTITVMHNGKGEKIRLYGIDCPEKG